MTTSDTSRATRIRLQWISFVVGIALTVVAVYDIVGGQHNISVWIAIICWPLVAVLSAVQLVRLSR